MVDDAEFAHGKYNAYILSDLPANYLTTRQQRLLAEAVRKGAGLMMLGGHSSFGDGGWADTPLADILPVQIHLATARTSPRGASSSSPTPWAWTTSSSRSAPTGPRPSGSGTR